MQPSNHQALVRITRSAQQTQSIGRTLASSLQPGDLLCLRGELGAGKTTFIQGLAQGLGVADLVTSPSFTLIHQHPGGIPLCHIDLYRIGPADVPEIGLEELLDCDAVVAVEWAEKLPPGLCRDALEIEITFHEAGEHTRRLSIRARGPRAAHLLSHLAEKSDVGPRA